MYFTNKRKRSEDGLNLSAVCEAERGLSRSRLRPRPHLAPRPLQLSAASRCCSLVAAAAQRGPRSRGCGCAVPPSAGPAPSSLPSASACGPFKHGGARVGGEAGSRRQPSQPAQPAAGRQLLQLRPAAGPVLAAPASHPLPQCALL